jgi:hypothetical protein
MKANGNVIAYVGEVYYAIYTSLTSEDSRKAHIYVTVYTMVTSKIIGFKDKGLWCFRMGIDL